MGAEAGDDLVPTVVGDDEVAEGFMFGLGVGVHIGLDFLLRIHIEERIEFDVISG